MYIRETIRCLDNVEVSAADRDTLYLDNAKKLLKIN